MSLPASIRVNVRAPFPVLVQGSGLITVTKANGIWTIGFAPQLIAVQNPLLNPGADQALVWDSAAKMMILAPLSTIAGVASRKQRSIHVAGDLPIVLADNILNINAVTDLAPVVPLASTRNGVALTFKNIPGSHIQTIARTSPDTLDGQNTLALAAGASLTLVPYNDGVNAGYSIE